MFRAWPVPRCRSSRKYPFGFERCTTPPHMPRRNSAEWRQLRLQAGWNEGPLVIQDQRLVPPHRSSQPPRLQPVGLARERHVGADPGSQGGQPGGQPGGQGQQSLSTNSPVARRSLAARLAPRRINVRPSPSDRPRSTTGGTEHFKKCCQISQDLQKSSYVTCKDRLPAGNISSWYGKALRAARSPSASVPNGRFFGTRPERTKASPAPTGAR